MKRIFGIMILMSAFTCFLTAQETVPAVPGQDAGPLFSAGISMGTDVLPGEGGTMETWNNLGFQPDLAFGKFGIGLDLTLRFKIMPDPDTAFEVYQGDWIPDYLGNGKSIFDIYLPKLQYVRYGVRGDPLFVKLGSINDLTVGSGFIMGNYANTRFMPTQRIFGMSAGIDGSLFKFPYLGLELLTGNLARFDVLGARLYVRPLVGTSIPILKNMQVGGSIAADFTPELYTDIPDVTLDPVAVYGADVQVPIIGGGLFPLNTFTEIAFQPAGRTGWMIGAGGSLFGIVTYGGQLRLLTSGFIPTYFDPNYDLYRAVKAQIVSQTPTGDPFAGWFASLGMSGFKNKVAFSVNMDGPFLPIPVVTTDDSSLYPHLRAVAVLGEGLLGGFSLDFAYDKYYLGRETGFFKDMIDPTDAVITAAVNYKTGAAVFTLLYNLTYNPENPDGFDITSSLKTSIKF